MCKPSAKSPVKSSQCKHTIKGHQIGRFFYQIGCFWKLTVIDCKYEVAIEKCDILSYFFLRIWFYILI